MAPSMLSCISDTFCSHRQASWFVLVTLSPIFLPFLILCVPFLLLFLAPVSVFLFSLFLLYKVQVSIRSKLKCFRRHAGKDIANEGYRPTQQIDQICQPAPFEEDRRLKELEDSNVHTHHKEGDRAGSGILTLSVSDVDEEPFEHLKEDPAAHDGVTEDKSEEKQEEQCIIDAPLVEEGREGRSREEPEVSSVQNVELAVSPGLQSCERERNFTVETQKETGQCLWDDKLEDKKQLEEQMTEESFEYEGEQEYSPLYMDAASSQTSEEIRASSSMTHEDESLDAPYSYDHQSTVPVEHLKEDPAAHDGVTEDKSEEKQEEHGIIDDPLVEEGREGRSPEEPDASTVQNVELAASPGLQSCERERNFTEETQKDTGQYLWDDKMEDKKQLEEEEDKKQLEEEMTEESFESKGEQELPPPYMDATSSQASEESMASASMTHEGESLDAPYSYDHRSSVPAEWRDQEERSERLESSQMHPLEEASGELPAIQVTEPTPQEAEKIILPDKVVEKPGQEEGQYEIDTPSSETPTQERLSSEKVGSVEIPASTGSKDQKEEIFHPAEPFEQETEEGEPSYDTPEGHGQWGMEALSKETGDNEQPKDGGEAKDLGESLETEPFTESKESYSYEATSAGEPLPHVSHGAIGFQDRMQEEQKIMSDIIAIKKIIGYEGETHVSLLEQIRALYMFLGMEPYEWGAEVDNLARAQAEIELLKVVVGIK